MKKHSKTRERSLTATVIMIAVVLLLFVAAYLRISDLTEDRCLRRMEEGINTAVDEITDKLMRDSLMLNAAADLLSSADSIDTETMKEMMSAFAPLMETMKVRVLMPDNSVIDSEGNVLDGTGSISFEAEAPLGEHVSNRMTSIMDGNLMILRHYIPIVKDGETVAIMYGVTKLDDLPKALNIDNIYNANSSVFIIDTDTGDFIMDTWHDTLGNIETMRDRKTKKGFNWDEKMAEIMSCGKGYVVFRSETDSEWTYLYYAPANINQWEIAISVPEREAFANLYAIRQIFMIIALLMGIAVIIYYLWMRKNSGAVMAKAVKQAVLEEKLQKAEAAEKAKTMFLSNMSHDIRTPMNAIIGFTTLAEANIDNKARVQEYLGKILSSSNHLLSLINDVLDMSRIESGRLNIEEKPCSISDIFKDMRNIIQTQMQEKSLNFFMDTIDVVDEDIFCDKLHVNQVLLNLLSNAIKFTPAGGSVSLTIKQKPCPVSGYGAYEIRVKDTGIGMSSEFAKDVFKPFERENNTTVSGIQGTGLGMAITKSIIEAMGGTIEVKTAQNRGTEFIINLEFRLCGESRNIEIVRELEGMRVLVVDDSFNTCDSVTKMLRQIGMRSEWTLHGKEAVLRARQAIEIGDKFFAYIIDWALPDLNGIEVTRQIRSVVGDDIPIIVLTAYDWSMFEDEARQAGVTAFCNKPIFISELRDILISALNQTEAPAPQKTAPLTVDDNRLKGRRLLLVEDNELNREIANEILIESGFKVETAADGTEAVNMVKNSKPGYFDLILMDVQMPVMDGYAATRAIRSLDNKELAKIPIVAMTANAFEEDRRAALDSGMNDHVAKPIDFERLARVLNRLLK